MARKPKTGPKSSIDKKREQPTDIRSKVVIAHLRWKIISLRRQLKNNAEALENSMIYRKLLCEFKKAIVEGSAKSAAAWFDAQAKAILWEDKRETDQLARAYFDAAVLGIVRATEIWNETGRKSLAAELTRVRRFFFDCLPLFPQPSLVLTPPVGKRVGCTAQQILDCFERRKRGNYLFVCIETRKGKLECRFRSARRAREAIRRIAGTSGYKLAG